MENLTARSRTLFVFMLVAVSLAASVTLWPLIRDAGFVYDDGAVVSDNPFIQNPGNLRMLFTADYYRFSGEQTYRPFVTLTYFIDYMFCGLNPFCFHFSNALFHFLASVFLGLVVFEICGTISTSLLATAVFSFHAAHFEAVACIAFREDILAAMFCFLSMFLFLKGRRHHRAPLFFISGSVFFILALLSKESAIVEPLLLGAVFYWFKQDFTREFVLKILTTTTIIVLLFLILWFIVFPGTEPYSQDSPPLLHRVRNIPAALSVFLHLCLFPDNLSVEHQKPISSVRDYIILPVLVLIIISGLYFRSLYGLGIVWFFLALSPMLNIFPALPNIVAERYLYLPLSGFSLAIAAVPELLKSGSMRKFRPVLLIAIVLFFVFIPAGYRQKRIPDWENNLSLWKSALHANPSSARVHTNLALALNRIAKDRKGAFRELKIAEKLAPGNPRVQFNLGVYFHEEKKLDQAEAYYRRALAIQPNYLDAHINLGKVLYLEKRYPEAAEQFRSALEIHPGSREIKYLLTMSSTAE